MVAALLALVALAGAAQAQLSASCIATLTTTLGQAPVSTCFATSALLPFFPLIATNTGTSILPTLSNYFGAVCPAPLCSNQTVATTLETIESGCSSLLNGFSINNATIDSYVPALPAIKNVVCLESTNTTALTGSTNGTDYCLIETLDTLQNITGQPLTFSLLFGLAAGTTKISSIFNSTVLASANQTLCTPCTKGLYNGFVSIANSSTIANATMANQTGLISQFMSVVSGVCGSAFINGSVPVGVMNGTSTNTSRPVATASASTTASGAFPMAAPVFSAGALAAVAFGVALLI